MFLLGDRIISEFIKFLFFNVQMLFRNAYSLMTETIFLRIIAKLIYLYLSFPILNALIPKEIVEHYNMTL